MMEQRTIPRSGYVKLGFYKMMIVPERLPNEMPFNDADHVFGLVNTVILFRDFFGDMLTEVYGFTPDWLSLVEEALIHEIGEVKIGDWPDDGSNDRTEKDQREEEAFNEFIRLFPKEAQLRHRRQFLAVRDFQTLTKLLDREMFPLGIGYNKSKGIVGSYEDKKNLTDKDLESYRQTGSSRAIDNICAGVLRMFYDFRALPIVAGINEAIYRLEYQEPSDPSVEGYVPGAPPPGVKKFYQQPPTNN